ncbi:MAG TPA: tetratricopeptide repeat protein [bacterium]|nr:tetratricopeptide repeat protein [bacterium]
MADKKEKKTPKKKYDFPIGIEPMSREEADAEMARFFAAIEEQYKDVPPSEMERGAKKIQDFIDGKLSWAELFDFTPEMLFHMAEFGFTQFKLGRYPDAERVFKVLTVLDWNNAYYHSVMGSILQRQKRYGDAIAEYTQAIELDPNDIVSYTNRGEIFMRHGLFEEARGDFTSAAGLDSEGKDKFANRARMLLEQMDRMGKEGAKET